MANSFLIVPELQEMLNKLELFYKSANTHYARNLLEYGRSRKAWFSLTRGVPLRSSPVRFRLYTDAKASIRSLIAIERGKDE